MPTFTIACRCKLSGQHETFTYSADNREDALDAFASDHPHKQTLACRETGAIKPAAKPTSEKPVYVPTRVLRARYEAKLAPYTGKPTDAPRSVAVTSLVTGETYDCALTSTEDHPC